MSQKEELKQRVNAKQKELESRLHELRADVQAGSREELQRIEQLLEEAKENLRNGWDEVSNEAAATLNDWLKKV